LVFCTSQLCVPSLENEPNVAPYSTTNWGSGLRKKVRDRDHRRIPSGEREAVDERERGRARDVDGSSNAIAPLALRAGVAACAAPQTALYVYALAA